MHTTTKPRRVHSRTAEVLCVILFITIMAAANLVVAHFGAWMLPFTAFFAVGVSLVSRDYLHDIWRDRAGAFWPRMLGMVAAAAVLSFAVDQGAGRVALASVIALTGSALAETFMFMALVKRPWLVRSNGSSIFGALADSVLFPIVAFGFTVEGLLLLVLAQTATKTVGSIFWSVIFRFTVNPDKRRAERARLREQQADERLVAHSNI